jgi:hypothetical protein
MKFIAYTNDKNYIYFTSKGKYNNHLNLISQKFHEYKKVYYDQPFSNQPFSIYSAQNSGLGRPELFFSGGFIPKIYINRWIMQIILPNKIIFTEVLRAPHLYVNLHYHYWVDDGYIFSDLYDICNITTLKKFNIPITLDYINVLCAFDKTDILDLRLQDVKNYMQLFDQNPRTFIWVSYGEHSEVPMDIASTYGSINVLQWWVDNNMPISYTYKALHNASVNGHINVLDWWKNSKLRLDYTEDILYVISLQINSNVIDNVIEWWLKSGLEIRYRYQSDLQLIRLASEKGHLKLLNHYKKKGLIGQGILGSFNSINVSVLDWWMYNYKSIVYNEDAIDNASENGSVDVLDWWFNSKLPLKYSEKALDNASSNGHLNVLNWWVNSKLPLKYSEKALDNASSNGHVNVLDWWVNSKLYLKYTYRALDIASEKGHINVLEWWKYSGRKLKYSDMAINNASIKGHINVLNVLEWWKNSGLKLKYCEMALHQCRCVNVLEWWFNSGLLLKYSKKYMKGVDNPYHIRTWWKKSELLLK